jgi:hypothetical protein
MKAICPKNPKHKKFITTAHEMHEWVVDEKGEFVKDLGCVETTAKPDPDNYWICKICNAHAKIEKD